MESNQQSQTAEQKLRFHGIVPSDFFDDVFNAVDEYLADCLDALENSLLERYPASSTVQKEALIKAVDAVYFKLEERLDKYWPKFEEYASRNSFVIPENLQLPEQEGEDRQEEDTDADSVERRQKLQQLRDELRALRQQRAEGEGVLASLRRDLRARERLVERHHRPSEVLKTLASQAANMNGGLVEAAWKLQSLMERAAAVRAARGRGGSESRAAGGQKRPMTAAGGALQSTTADLEAVMKAVGGEKSM